MSKYLDLYINQGETFVRSLTAYDNSNSPINLFGATGYCHLRTSYYSDNYKEMNVSITGGTGNFVLSMGATSSSALKAVRYVYDVEFHYSDGSVIRSHQGSAFIDPEVTK